MPCRPLPLLVLLLAVPPSLHAAEPSAQQAEFFEKKVRPLLAEHCFRCHGGDKHRGGLVLDGRDGLLKGGDSGPAVVPGDPEKSRLVRAIRYQDADLRMPPRSKLADEQIADLVAWVKMGAPWPGKTAGVQTVREFDLVARRREHWAWRPVQKVAPPSVRSADWVRTPPDAFVLARLEAAGLAPAPPADRATWLRRVTYDLIGLPPTPAEIEAFLNDASPRAHESVVERLLDSPHYGERWARHWLDLVRYAETSGHEFDFEMPEAYRYRDYLIRAFNADLPFDQLVREHVAGDLLPEPRRHPTEGFDESVLGSGFWFLGEGKHSPVDIRAEEATRIDNQIDVFSKAFLGLTVACARCHDHKFDAISQADYYALYGYLRSSRYQRAFLDGPDRNRDAVARIADLDRQARPVGVEAAAALLEAAVPELARRLGEGKRPAAIRQRFQLGTGRAAAGDERYSVIEDFAKPGYDGWFVTGEAFGDGPAPAGGVQFQADRKAPVRALFAHPTAHSGRVSERLQGALRSRSFPLDRKFLHFRVAGREGRINLIIDGFQFIRAPIYGGLTLNVNHGDEPRWMSIDVSMWQGHLAYVELLDDGPGFLAVEQIVASDHGPPPPVPNPVLAGLLDGETVPADLENRLSARLAELVRSWREDAPETDDADRLELLQWMLAQARALPAVTPEGTAGRLAALLEVRRKAEADLALARRGMAMADGTGVDEFVHVRGNYKIAGEVVPRRLLTALDGKPDGTDGGSGRLELARRLTRPDNPLVARVLVNRLWMHHFGEGIVRSVDNFGALGEKPTHPELLDWLAAEFVGHGWSIKHMHRLMVLSSSYRMASKSDPAAEQKDPNNLLLHRMPIRRLEAEAVRDALLAVSGRLDRKMFGPGVMPHLTPFMAGRGRPGRSGPLDGEGRRSIYINVRRNFLTPLFLAFDYPVPFTTIGRRGVSNVPAQALAMLNNPLVLQQAELWARRTLADAKLTSDRQRIDRLYLEAFGRPATEAERADALAFVAGTEQKPAERLRAWSDLCHVLFNVKEFLYVG